MTTLNLLTFDNLVPAVRTSSTVLAMPVGFRATGGVVERMTLHTLTTEAPTTLYRGFVTTEVVVQAPTTAGPLFTTFTWLTLDPWPTTLPGIPAGAIPAT